MQTALTQAHSDLKLKVLETEGLKREITQLQAQMNEEMNNYHYYEEGLEYLKKTIEKQRVEINGMKDKVRAADERVREVEINREAMQMQHQKEKVEVERKLKRKSQRYKRKISEMLQELTSLTQKNHWIAEEARDKQ